MDRFVIEGGRRLSGTVDVRGSKNAVLPIMAAALLTREPLVIEGVPDLRDVRFYAKLLQVLGCEVSSEGSTMRFQTCNEEEHTAPYDLVSKMRGTVTTLGPLLARRGRARVSLPGGCVLGVRPIDLHLKGLRALGAKIKVEHGYIDAVAPPGGLVGAEIFLGSSFGPTVLGTANVLMAAVLARGKTVIECAACEPEVVDLARCLVEMGAQIEGIGSHRLVIHGVPELTGAHHRVIPDRIEAATFIVAGLMTRSEITVRNMRSDHLTAFFDKLLEAGAEMDIAPTRVITKPTERLNSVEFTTLAYPGFPTDLQAQMMALLTLSKGVSVITERIFPDRFMHASELMRLGANIRREGPMAIVEGSERLSGAPVMASDLRASAALVLAGMVAEGETEVQRVYHIDRGYERIEERLNALGASIRRVNPGPHE
ncbi:MAG: UDP-N-acetylglucosamine 1-carboxyvinyltransferase [Planctomycetes bacterium]|nr:UDP-N-acetylglucosamine 1-carboxyvinyltransferase [Planctomycetota bacterium]